MDSEVVIFGASSGGIKVAQTLKSFGIDFYCFIDNDSKKWGTKVSIIYNNGERIYNIYSPTILFEKNCRIIIASEHQAEIEKQLEEMGILTHVILKEDLLIPLVEKMLPELCKYVKFYEKTKDKKVIIDLAEGVQLGGIETWTYTVTRELCKVGVKTEIFTKKTEMQPPEDIKKHFIYFNIEYGNFKENVFCLALEIIKRSPCVVIINKHTQLLYAAYLAKELCTQRDIKIISVIHNDLITLYRRQQRIDYMTDAICCVSKRIWKRMIYEFKISQNKIFYKESPVYLLESDYDFRTYTTKANEPLKLGYAGRLTKFQKRVDLIPKFLEELERLHCNYCLSIAGDGIYKKTLEEYIIKSCLEQKVILLGKISQKKIAEFWKKQDIFLSFSDFEGVGLSMLEAMSQGVIPIETDVAGAEEFIENDKNGYVVSIGDVKQMAKYVAILDKDRDRLEYMGKDSYHVVKMKCNPKDYALYIKKICEI